MGTYLKQQPSETPTPALASRVPILIINWNELNFEIGQADHQGYIQHITCFIDNHKTMAHDFIRSSFHVYAQNENPADGYGGIQHRLSGRSFNPATRVGRWGTGLDEGQDIRKIITERDDAEGGSEGSSGNTRSGRRRQSRAETGLYEMAFRR